MIGIPMATPMTGQRYPLMGAPIPGNTTLTMTGICRPVRSISSLIVPEDFKHSHRQNKSVQTTYPG